MSHKPADNQSKTLVYPPEDLPYKAVARYLDNCRDGLASLKAALERSDYDFVDVYSHRMKGSGAAYGFPKLTELGASMEEAARVRNGSALWDCAAMLEAHLQAVVLVEP